jgi:mRNA interferase RelE/StbE
LTVAPGDPPIYRVEFKASALKELDALQRREQARIIPRINALANNPRPHGSIKLQGQTDQYRIRIGNYRVVYEISDDVLLVLVVQVGHRRDVYRGI